ncbi:MAG: DUF1993 domain-containing protein [Kofleriaceae bacterium]
MNMFEQTVPQLAKMLRNLDKWLKAAETYAEQRKFPVDNLIQCRLAPDQYPLVRQVQTSCDNAKFIAGRLSGKEWPAHADTETTFEQLHQRIAAVIAYLDTMKPEDFSDAAGRKVSLPWMAPKWMTGVDYLTQFGLPNFYFHVSLAYGILRHNGVPLAKNDYIGNLPVHE